MTWRCFHCDDVFEKRSEASAHFGYQVDATPACKIAPDLRGLIKFMRLQESELHRLRRDDSDAARQLYALGAEHAVALRSAEEKGYARGLHDANAAFRDLVGRISDYFHVNARREDDLAQGYIKELDAIILNGTAPMERAP
jgi:hypothetical protein